MFNPFAVFSVAHRVSRLGLESRERARVGAVSLYPVGTPEGAHAVCVYNFKNNEVEGAMHYFLPFYDKPEFYRSSKIIRDEIVLITINRFSDGTYEIV
jgi:hypothetical protein